MNIYGKIFYTYSNFRRYFQDIYFKTKYKRIKHLFFQKRKSNKKNLFKISLKRSPNQKNLKNKPGQYNQT